jgi:hypothetical protein
MDDDPSMHDVPRPGELPRVEPTTFTPEEQERLLSLLDTSPITSPEYVDDDNLSFISFTYLDLVMVRDGVEALNPDEGVEVDRRAAMLALLEGEIEKLRPLGDV